MRRAIHFLFSCAVVCGLGVAVFLVLYTFPLGRLDELRNEVSRLESRMQRATQRLNGLRSSVASVAPPVGWAVVSAKKRDGELDLQRSVIEIMDRNGVAPNSYSQFPHPQERGADRLGFSSEFSTPLKNLYSILA